MTFCMCPKPTLYRTVTRTVETVEILCRVFQTRPFRRFCNEMFRVSIVFSVASQQSNFCKVSFERDFWIFLYTPKMD